MAADPYVINEIMEEAPTGALTLIAGSEVPANLQWVLNIRAVNTTASLKTYSMGMSKSATADHGANCLSDEKLAAGQALDFEVALKVKAGTRFFHRASAAGVQVRITGSLQKIDPSL